MDIHMVALATAESERKDNWLSYARRGQTFGMTSQCIFVAAAFAAVYLHQIWLAGMFIAGPALGVAIQFIKGISERPEAKHQASLHEREEKSTKVE